MPDLMRLHPAVAALLFGLFLSLSSMHADAAPYRGESRFFQQPVGSIPTSEYEKAFDGDTYDSLGSIRSWIESISYKKYTASHTRRPGSGAMGIRSTGHPWVFA